LSYLQGWLIFRWIQYIINEGYQISNLRILHSTVRDMSQRLCWTVDIGHQRKACWVLEEKEKCCVKHTLWGTQRRLEVDIRMFLREIDIDDLNCDWTGSGSASGGVKSSWLYILFQHCLPLILYMLLIIHSWQLDSIRGWFVQFSTLLWASCGTLYLFV
jgi:hypothetical protein